MEVVNTVLGFVRDYLLQPAIRHTGYALHVKTEIKKLRDKMEKLMAIEEDVGRQLEVAQHPSSLVPMWQSKVKNLKEEVEQDLKMELNCGHFCPNFISRCKLGKRVAKYLVVAKELEGEASGFGAGTSIDLNLPNSAKANFEDLREKIKVLSQKEADINSMVGEGKRVHGLQPKYEVEGWLQMVVAHKRDVDEICSEFHGRKEESDSVWKVSADLNSRVHKILEKTKDLIKKGRGFGSNVSDPSRPTQVVRQSEITSIGQDKAYRDVRNLIQSGNSGIIGIYGMGGVGKTTLLKRINNSLVGLGYEIVIFVVVSKDGNIASVQKDILRRMGKDAENTSALPRENIIRNCLQDKKFILLLDDIWNKLNLEDLGVPTNIYEKNSNSKILFTTRLENVCDQMKAKKVKIECLNVEEAWELFERTVGASFRNSNFGIKEIAEQVAKECDGLPLALKVIGEAMSSKRTIDEWQDALTTLRKSRPAELRGTEEDLYKILRFSYDNLPNDNMKECFCYCALFPEDYEINSSDIVGCWIGEGFFHDCDGIDEARNRGYTIIEDLKQACLLEEVKHIDRLLPPQNIKLKLHDVVRDMALWIKKGKFVVVTTNAKLVPKMEEVERLSIILSDGELRDLNQTALVCPKLSTFLVEHGLVDKLSDEFFQGMTNLKVMHVYDRGSMRECGRVPSSIRNLIKLRYLNLGDVTEELLGSWELGELQSLEQLTMAIRTYEVNYGVIGRLSNLRVLSLTNSSFRIQATNCGVKIEPEFKSLRAIEDLSLPINSSSDLRELACPELVHSVSRLVLSRLLDMTSFVLASEIGRMNRLKTLYFYSCKSLQKIEMEEEDDGAKSTSQQDHVVPPRSSLQYPKLTYMGFWMCERLQTVMCVGITQHIFIQRLKVAHCIRVEQVFKQGTRSEGTAEYVFQALQQIELNSLFNLKSICSDAFTFPHLEVLIVFGCPKLKKLPRGIIQASKGALLREIRGNRMWWNGLEWDSLEDKTSVLPFFKPFR